VVWADVVGGGGKKTKNTCFGGGGGGGGGGGEVSEVFKFQDVLFVLTVMADCTRGGCGK